MDARARVQVHDLTEENERLRTEIRELRVDCQKLQETSRQQETHISILTRTCEQLVDELDSLGEQTLPHSPTPSGLTLLTPPSSGRSSYSSLPDSDVDSCPSTTSIATSALTHTHTQNAALSCHRCQSLAEELSFTRQELKSVDWQLQCAAKQKFKLQEKLCHFEEDIGILIQRGLSHKLE